MKAKTFHRDVIIGKKVRRVRILAGMTQTELAKKLDISPQQLQKYEKGINKISASRVEMISEILNIPVTTFFGSKKKKQPEDEMLSTPSKAALHLARIYMNIPSEKLRRLLLLSARVYTKE